MEYTKLKKLNDWISEIVQLCQPNDVYVCNGSTEEYDRLAKQLVGKSMKWNDVMVIVDCRIRYFC